MIKKNKIAYVLPEMKLGGSEKHVIELAEGLQVRGHDVKIVCLFREGILAKDVREKGIPFMCLNLKEAWSISTLLHIFKWLRKESFTILHTYLFGFHLFVGLPARLCRIPVILSSRRDMEFDQSWKVLWIEKFGNYFVDLVVCCSELVRDWTLKREQLKSDQTMTIYNGIKWQDYSSGNGASMRKEFGIPKDDIIVGAVANFSFKKGYSFLIEAAESVLSKRPDVWFLCVGSGYLEDEMRQRAKESRFGDRVIFTGKRRDIPDFMNTVNIFVLSSLWEGLPNVLLQAMAAGCPIISTDVGGISELIQSGKDGLLIQPKNSQLMANTILTLLENPNQAKNDGTQCARKN